MNKTLLDDLRSITKPTVKATDQRCSKAIKINDSYL